MPPPTLVGQILGDTYRVERLLGQGGMGAVYLASHLRLPTRVAIKVLHGEAAVNPEIFARFRREAEIASSLRHPNIVQVFDFNRLPDGTPYLIMEFLEGEDLAARLRARGRLSYAETSALCQAVGAALSMAHMREVVHRDLKPQNIFLARHQLADGIVEIPTIVDFGISKIRHAVVDSLKTRDQQILGTPNYMSPEQARGLNSLVDHRTDQWALAAIMYECLTGRLAFTGDSLAAIIYQVVLAEPPPLRSLAPEAPACAEEAIRQALSKERDRRFPSILDFVRAFCGTPSVSAGTPATGPGDHPILSTPVQLGLGSTLPTDGTAGGSLPGSGSQRRDGSPGQRRLILGASGLLIGAAAVSAWLLLAQDPPAPRSQPVADLARPAPDLARPDLHRPEDLGQPLPSVLQPMQEPPAVRERSRTRPRDRDQNRRLRLPSSDADDVDISGIR